MKELKICCKIYREGKWITLPQEEQRRWEHILQERAKQLRKMLREEKND